ncbi:hypothetical protein F2P81_000341 [Scophthalmus maximus]|uniref:Uncharacterized protein n=1 Tax=Scophthalmus maximus TaxID=52904 RepID=A0A6A4TQR7_SCOMX|nr:hypothetical protein F2P81_000341 [Scophthalmus maximus]
MPPALCKDPCAVKSAIEQCYRLVSTRVASVMFPRCYSAKTPCRLMRSHPKVDGLDERGPSPHIQVRHPESVEPNNGADELRSFDPSRGGDSFLPFYFEYEICFIVLRNSLGYRIINTIQFKKSVWLLPNLPFVGYGVFSSSVRERWLGRGKFWESRVHLHTSYRIVKFSQRRREGGEGSSVQQQGGERIEVGAERKQAKGSQWNGFNVNPTWSEKKETSNASVHPEYMAQISQDCRCRERSHSSTYKNLLQMNPEHTDERPRRFTGAKLLGSLEPRAELRSRISSGRVSASVLLRSLPPPCDGIGLRCERNTHHVFLCRIHDQMGWSRSVRCPQSCGKM